MNVLPRFTFACSVWVADVLACWDYIYGIRHSHLNELPDR